MDETTMLITIALLAGFIGGALARQSEMKRLKKSAFAWEEAAYRTGNKLGGAVAVNVALVRELERIGLPWSINVENKSEVEWPEEIEVRQ